MLTKRNGRTSERRPRRVLPVLAAAALGLGAIGLVASPASAAGKGPVYVQPWCQQQTTKYNGQDHKWTYDNVNAFPTSPTNPYSWVCSNSTIQQVTGVDMNAACALRYGNPGHAVLGNSRDPYSWYCV